MARITHLRDCLKNDFFKHLQTLRDLLSANDIVAAAVEAKYSWRDRVWNPGMTVWTFLIQVLHPDAPCREACLPAGRPWLLFWPKRRPNTGALNPRPQGDRGSLQTRVPIARLASVFPWRSSRPPSTTWATGSRRRFKTRISGVAEGSGWPTAPRSPCPIPPNCKRPLGNPPAKSPAVGFPWPGSWPCSPGPAERCWRWPSLGGGSLPVAATQTGRSCLCCIRSGASWSREISCWQTDSSVRTARWRSWCSEAATGSFGSMDHDPGRWTSERDGVSVAPNGWSPGGGPTGVPCGSLAGSGGDCPRN